MKIDLKSHQAQIDTHALIDTGVNMNNLARSIVSTDEFSFAARELPAKLLAHIQRGKTGYWQHQFDLLADRAQPFYWNLAVANGQILYSGTRFWSSQMLFRVVERYVLPPRSDAVKSQFDLIKDQIQQKAIAPAKLIGMMKESNIISETQLRSALRTKILNDLDIYLSIGSGSARFIAEDINNRLPINGFSPIAMFEEARQRQLQWTQLRQQIPSMKLYPILDRAAIAKANLSTSQRQRIETLVKSDRSLNEIAEDMAKDNLEVALMFAKLAKAGLVKFQPPPQQTRSDVMVIDDSPLLLSQFQHWVSALGYSVTICQDAKTALAKILTIGPSVVFIDINMPEISGFELVKQIRQHPALQQISLAILTGEQKLSNKWRAQWSGCEFVAKPLTTAAIADFQVQLEELIPRLLSASKSLSQN